MKLKEVDQPSLTSRQMLARQLARRFDLDFPMIEKLQRGDPEKLTWMWIQQGIVDYRTFTNLLRYIAHTKQDADGTVVQQSETSNETL